MNLARDTTMSLDKGITASGLIVYSLIFNSRTYYTDRSSCTWSHLVRRYSRPITMNTIGVINTRGAANKGIRSMIYIGVDVGGSKLGAKNAPSMECEW